MELEGAVIQLITPGLETMFGVLTPFDVVVNVAELRPVQ
jgi:hypothetical protein